MPIEPPRPTEEQRASITATRIDATRLEALVSRPGAGAVVVFKGVTRDNFDGRGVVELEYDAYPEMAVPVMDQICDEVSERWPEARVAMAHRTGKVGIGEASVVIVASAPHRDAAYLANRYAIDQLKARVPVWKKERYSDGASWKTNAESGLGAVEAPVRPASPPAPRPPMKGPGGRRGGFVDRPPEEMKRPEVNPHIALHRAFGPPVIVGEDAPAFRGRWADAFGARDAEGEPRPLHVELGSGNGFFLAGMAARHPERDWLGIEIRYKRVVLCARKIKAAGVSNARITRYDGWFLDDLFTPGSLAGLYVNFPDPWPKERHAKNRLLGRHLAEWAERALAPGATWRLKTDHRPNRDRLEGAVDGLAFEVVGRSDDVAAEGPPWGDDDIVTNYQTKFDQRGEPIYALELRRG